MKKSKYSDSQILSLLKQSEAGTAVPKLCRNHGMSSATLVVSQKVFLSDKNFYRLITKQVLSKSTKQGHI